MAKGYAEEAQNAQARRALKVWVFGIAVAAATMFAAGLLLASQVSGPVQPWMGLGFAVSMGLAIVVGLSKTSSA